MRTFTRLAATLSVVCVAVLAATALANAANTRKAPKEAATIVRLDGACNFLDANGALWNDPDSRAQVVATNNKNGGANAYCQGNLPAGAALPEQGAIHYDESTGIGCIAVGETWRMTITPNGKASFTCHVN